MLVKRVEVESVEDCRRSEDEGERGQKKLPRGSAMLHGQFHFIGLVEGNDRGSGGNTKGTL